MSLNSTMRRAWDMLDKVLERKQKDFKTKLRSDREIAELQTSADIERQRLANRGSLDVAERQQAGATKRHMGELDLKKRDQSFGQMARNRDFTYQKKQDRITNELKRDGFDLKRDRLEFEQDVFSQEFGETRRLKDANLALERMEQLRKVFAEVYPADQMFGSGTGSSPNVSRKQKWDMFSATEDEKKALRQKMLELRRRQGKSW